MTTDDVPGLEPLGAEGGMRTQTWRDEHGSAIYFLMRPGDVSTDERRLDAGRHHHGAPYHDDGFEIGTPALLDRYMEARIEIAQLLRRG